MAKKDSFATKLRDAISHVLYTEEEDDDFVEEPYPEGNFSSNSYNQNVEYVPPRQRTRPVQGGSMVPRGGYGSSRPTRTPQNGGRSGRGNPGPRNTSGRRPTFQEGPRQQPYDYRTPSSSRFGSLNGAPGNGQRSTPRGSSRPRTVMFTLHNLEDCCDVIDNLIIDNTVVLTMDEMDGMTMQRAVDTLSGAVFALHATIRKASAHTYLIAPSGVEVNETYDMDPRF